MFLEISQNSQENTCARVSFLIKLQAAFLIEYLYWMPLNSDIVTDALYSEFNRLLETSVFPPTMKLANITYVHKKDNRQK